MLIYVSRQQHFYSYQVILMRQILKHKTIKNNQKEAAFCRELRLNFLFFLSPSLLLILSLFKNILPSLPSFFSNQTTIATTDTRSSLSSI